MIRTASQTIRSSALASVALLAACGQAPPRNSSDVVAATTITAKPIVPKVDETPQIRVAASSGHNPINIFPAFGRTYVVTKGYVAELGSNGLVPHPELAKGFETAYGQPVGFYGSFPNDAYAVLISYGERSESYDVYKWENASWKSAPGREHMGQAIYFTSPSGEVGAFRSYSDTPFSKLDQKPMAGAPKLDGARFVSIAATLGGIVALEDPAVGESEGRVPRYPRVVHWSKAGNEVYELPTVGIAQGPFMVSQIKAKGSRAVVFGSIGGSDNGNGQPQPYVATFDGKVWSRIDCPATMGEPGVGQLSPDGTLYLRTTTHKPAANGNPEVSTEHLWVRPVGGSWSSIDLPTNAGGAKCWYQDIEADENALWLTASCDNDEGPQHVLFTSHPSYAKGRTPEKIGMAKVDQKRD